MEAMDNRERLAKDLAREERARDAAQAVLDYEARKLAESVKTERLRTLRLANEAAGLENRTRNKK